MKNAIVLMLLSIPALAFADARLELNTGAIHAPWSNEDADYEYKNTDGSNSIGSLQHPDGTYTAQYQGAVLGVDGAMIDADLEFGPGNGQPHRFRTTETDCVNQEGTFQDDDGNQFTTNDCAVVITYERLKKDADEYNLFFDVRLYRASAAAEAETVQMPSVSKAFR